MYIWDPLAFKLGFDTKEKIKFALQFDGSLIVYSIYRWSNSPGVIGLNQNLIYCKYKKLFWWKPILSPGGPVEPYLAKYHEYKVDWQMRKWQDLSSWSIMKRNRFDPTAQYRENVQNVPKYQYFFWFENCRKLLIFWHVLDVFALLSDRIKPIPFHERSSSHGTSLEYNQQQGNHSNLKIRLFRLRGGLGGTLGICFWKN